MLICIPNVLTQEQVQFCREQLAQAEWVDGKVTTGAQSATVKANQQVEQNSPIAKQLGEMITRTLSNLPRFIAAALPSKIFPPLFNCYRDGGFDVSFGGFAPADDARFTVYVVVRHPRAGGAAGGVTAGPVFHEIMNYVLQKYAVPPTETEPANLPAYWGRGSR